MKRFTKVSSPVDRPMLPCQRAMEPTLEKVRSQISPDDFERVVAVDRETGNFVIGDSFGQAFREFRKKYPDAWPYISKVDGSPALRM
jgi:hypothetical protein